MGGGKIVIRPPRTTDYNSHENSIMGNTCLYGATDGFVFAAGQAGERFAIRNSGVQAVVEGLGDHGCEYMTNGVVVVLGEVGRNFGAGMSGGIAFIYDVNQTFPSLYNKDMLVIDRLADSSSEDEDHLFELIKEHATQTGSTFASYIIENWEAQRGYFWKAMPAQLRFPVFNNITRECTSCLRCMFFY
jgi:glutamate synthase domain-containing protein 3